MMRSSKWDEKAIENQLKKMPKIQDSQSKEALYEKIQERLQERKFEKTKKKSWLMPTFATAAVLFLLLLIVPSFINEQDLTVEEPSIEDTELRMEVNEDHAPEMAITQELPGIATTDKVTNDFYFEAVQPNDEFQFGDDLVTIAVSAHYQTGELVVPVTVLSDGASVLEKFLTVTETFSGERWGIGAFPPLQINSITEEKGGVVVIDVPVNSLESLSSAEMKTYSLALKETFSALGFNKISFTSDGEKGVFWGQHGPLDEMELQETNRGYYIFESDTGHKYLVRGRAVDPPTPEVEEKYKNLSFQETLELMKQSNRGLGYSASIPVGVTIASVEQNDDLVLITFAEETLLENNEVYVAMIEAIMFTAKDFGFQNVRFEGTHIDQIGPYKMNDLLEIPNYMNFIR